MSRVASQSAEESAKDHELLIHTLTHEHSVSNVSRHEQALRQWTKDYAEGFFIRDLHYVIQIFGILRERLASHQEMFREILSRVLKVAALPLFESKANERLKAPCVDIIKAYFLELCYFWTEDDPVLNGEVTKCFRSIVNGGLDPTILKGDIQKWKDDGFRKQVTDKIYLQTLLRDSTAVSHLVKGFLSGSCAYETEFNNVNAALDAIAAREAEREKEKAEFLKKMTKSGKHTKDVPTDEDDSDDDLASKSEVQSDTNKATKSGGGPDKTLMGDYQELMKGTKCLMMELTADTRTSALMCAEGICDGAVRLLCIAASTSPRDPQVAANVDLIWTVMESYLSLVPATSALGDAAPAAQPPSPTFGAPSPTLSLMSIADDGASEGKGFEAEDGVDSGPSEAAALILSGQPLTLQQLLEQNIMDFDEVVISLLRVFTALVHDGYRMADKECRNEILVCLSMLSTFKSAAASFMSSNALTIFTTYACIAEVGKTSWAFFARPIPKIRNFGSIHDIDLQLKRELWLVIMDILSGDDPDALLTVSSSPLMDTLLAYLEFDSFEPAPSKGSMILGESQSGANFSPSRSRSQVLPDGGQSEVMNSANQQQAASPAGNEEGDTPNLHELEDPSNYQTMNVGPKSYLTPEADAMAHRFLKQLPLNELLELQVTAASFLATSAVKLLGEFLRIQGPVRILDIAYKYSRSNVPEHKAMVYQCLLLLNRCMMVSEEVKMIMEAENAIETFLLQFEHTDEDDTRTIAARLISILCSRGNQVCQQQVREQGGLALLIKVLLKYAENRRVQVGKKAGVKIAHQHEGDDDVGDDGIGGSVSIVVVAIIDCLHKSVVGNRRSEATFAQNEGVDMILNLLEVSQFLQRVQILRTLADLLENNRLLSFLFAWRSPKSMRTAAQIFAHCWLDEEARLNTSRGKDGIITNIEEPLKNHDWPVDTITQAPGESVSSEGSLTLGVKSMTVTRLSEAISHSRVNYGVVPQHLRDEVLSKDTRCILARILLLAGVTENYNRDPPGGYFDDGLGGSLVELGSQVVLDVEGNPVVADPGDAQPSIDDMGSSLLEISQVQGGVGEEKYGESNGPARAMEKPQATHIQDSSLHEGGGFGGSMSQSVTVAISNDPGLRPTEKQVVSLVNQYSLLREGEWWRCVRDELIEKGIEPIESDGFLMQSKIGAAFDAAFVVQAEQMELFGSNQDMKRSEEEGFIGQLLAKKDAEIKTAWLKSHGKGGATANPMQSVPY